ncbi:MAG: DUF805 domain-containing protein [Eubacteriales bacterium]
MNEYIAFWKNYVNFKGRTTRKGFWIPYLANNILLYALVGIDGGLSGYLGTEATALFEIFGGLYVLGLIIPTISIMVRRLNDIGKNWKWYFISYIPCIGSIWFFILLVTPSAPDNGVPTV